MKKLIYLILSALMFASCSDIEISFLSSNFSEEEVSSFEQQYITARSVNTKTVLGDNTIQLIGYTTVKFYGDEAKVVKKIWAEHIDEINGAGCYLISGSQVRIYSPLSYAVAEVDGKTVIANESGIIHFEGIDTPSKIVIKGRKASPNCIDVTFKKTIGSCSYYKDYSAVVFDLGEKNVSCSEKKAKSLVKSGSESAGSHVSCTENHSPYHNCTEAFPEISQGRCPTVTNRCMDYNGYGTNCSGSRLYFIGSDCCVALSNGLCWAEVGK